MVRLQVTYDIQGIPDYIQDMLEMQYGGQPALTFLKVAELPVLQDWMRKQYFTQDVVVVTNQEKKAKSKDSIKEFEDVPY